MLLPYTRPACFPRTEEAENKMAKCPFAAHLNLSLPCKEHPSRPRTKPYWILALPRLSKSLSANLTQACFSRCLG